MKGLFIGLAMLIASVANAQDDYDIRTFGLKLTRADLLEMCEGCNVDMLLDREVRLPHYEFVSCRGYALLSFDSANVHYKTMWMWTAKEDHKQARERIEKALRIMYGEPEVSIGSGLTTFVWEHENIIARAHMAESADLLTVQTEYWRGARPASPHTSANHDTTKAIDKSIE